MAERRSRRRDAWVVAGLALAASGCDKVHLYAKHSSDQESAFFVARQPPMYEQMQPAQLRLDLPADGRLVITFSTMGVVQAIDASADLMPPLVVQCRLDGKPCVANNDGGVQFKFPPERPQVWSYDSRAYTWVVSQAAKGGHTVEIWGMFGFPNLAKLVTLINWSLVVEAFDN